jgi:hypothetical protein
MGATHNPNPTEKLFFGREPLNRINKRTKTMADYFKLACAATRNIYFDHERVARAHVKGLEENIKSLKDAGVTDEGVDRYISAVKDWWGKEAKCASPMIVGPANFPVERQRKRRESANKANEKMAALFTSLIRATEPKKKYTPQDEIKRLRECAASACWSSARKRYATAADKLEAEQAAGTVEVVLPSGVRIMEDKEAMRLKIFFTCGKPSQEVIDLLKKHAFKWAPSTGVWQRQLTDKARSAFETDIKPVIQ